MRAAAFVGALLLSLATLGALVMVFAFAYMAVFTPGVDDDLAGASFLTFLATLTLAGLSAAAWLGFDVAASR